MKEKKTILSLAILSAMMALVITPASGQRIALRRPFEKGTLIGTGGFTYSNSGGELYNQDGERTTQFSFNPSISYFVTSGLALGLRGSISYTSRGGQTGTGLGIGPEVSYYLRKKRDAKARVVMAKGTIVPYFSAGAMFSGTSGNYPTQWGNYDYKNSGTTLDLGAGFLYMLSQGYGIFVRASFEYSTKSQNGGDSKHGNRFVITGGLSAFGF